MAIGTTVYAICNYSTGEAYIGETVSIPYRWRGHRALLQKGKHHNRALQAAWNRDGASSFSLVILERVPEPIDGRSNVIWCNEPHAALAR